MIKFIVNLLIKWCEWRGRVFNITGTGADTDVYLIRYYVIQSKYFNFFIHRFLRSDRDDLHDHPWNFMTYLVSGAYRERKWNEETKEIDTIVRFNFKCGKSWTDHTLVHHKVNRLVFRKATDQHQVVVYNNLIPDQKEDATLTICITGPTKREWGFIKEVTVQKDGITPISEKYRPIREWIPWKKYLGLPDDTPGRG